MKSTIKVSISGIAFNLDNDAYGCLKNYLDRVDKIFSGKEGGREIIEDIEVRIAELLSAQIQSPAQIITLAMISEVIGTVGSADDIAGGGDEETTTFAQEQFKATEPERKRLFRDIDHRVIGGVCSGLGNYFGIEKVLVRLAFAILVGLTFAPGGLFTPPFFGKVAFFVTLLYIILWIAMPAARTMKEKMNMRKEPLLPPLPPLPPLPFTLDEPVKAAHEGDLGHVLGKIIIITCRIIAGFVLAIMTFIALTLLAALPIGLITGNVVVGELGNLDLARFVQDYTFIPLWLVVTLLTLLVCVPLIGLAYLLSKALFKFKTKIRMGLILTVTWLVTFFSLVGIGIYIASNNVDFSKDLFSENSSSMVSETRTFAPFTNLSIAGTFEVTAVPSDTNYILIKATEKILPHIRTETTNNGDMKIYVERVRAKGWAKAHIVVYYSDWKSVEQLRLSGAVRFTCSDTLKAPTFSAKLSGASNIDIAVNNRYSDLDVSGASQITANIIAEKINIGVSGASKATLSGKSPYVDSNLSGASKISAGNLAADTVKIQSSGSSKMDIQANNFLDIHASGASHIEYSGTPVTDIFTSGAAKVRHAN
ncbi:MAG: DUF2807 domain-containing protein [Prevotellaceae bacterium]|jgi:phage shock protein PspC (stress-responsive transcriptional regulator)|nr:DUF2807 domain-containing protein [Prevotellaceae bacterium]